MRFYRGITVPQARVGATIARILEVGLGASDGGWKMTHVRPRPTRTIGPQSAQPAATTLPRAPAVCASGDLETALYYACIHNRTAANDTPLVMVFDADAADASVDGKDFLFHAFGRGVPERALPVLIEAFGPAIRAYAEAAWARPHGAERLAFCDLAIHDPDVVAAHHASRRVLGGRNSLVFRSAFTVTLPVTPAQIVSVQAWNPDAFRPPAIDTSLFGLLNEGP